MRMNAKLLALLIAVSVSPGLCATSNPHSAPKSSKAGVTKRKKVVPKKRHKPTASAPKIETLKLYLGKCLQDFTLTMPVRTKFKDSYAINAWSYDLGGCVVFIDTPKPRAHWAVVLSYGNMSLSCWNVYLFAYYTEKKNDPLPWKLLGIALHSFKWRDISEIECMKINTLTKSLVFMDHQAKVAGRIPIGPELSLMEKRDEKSKIEHSRKKVQEQVKKDHQKDK